MKDKSAAFFMEDCTGVPEFYTLLTLVYNFVHYNSIYNKLIPNILHEVNKLYPKVNIIAAVPSTFSMAKIDIKHVSLISSKIRYALNLFLAN